MSTSIPPHSKAVSRADLVRWLIESGEGTGSLRQVAAFAGFQRLDKPLLKWQEQAEREKAVAPFQQMERIIADDTSEGLISTCWFHVASRERFESQQDSSEGDGPLSIREVRDFTQEDLTPASSASPELQALLPWARLWPVMKGQLSASQPGRIDIPRLTEWVARGGLLTTLPRLQWRHWAAEVIILLDFNQRVVPFWDDFQQLRAALAKLRGESGLDVREQTGIPGIYYTVHTQPEQGVKMWTMPASETPILILSDLGMLEPSGTLRKHWLHFGRRLKAAAIQPFVLAPVSPQHIDPELSRYYHIALWDRSSRLLRQQQRSETDDKEQLEQLLILLSPAIRIEPELLRAVRHLLSDAVFDAGLETAFWQHPHVDTSPVACALRSEHVETYRARFREQPLFLQREVLNLIRQHHVHLFPTVIHEETLIWSGLAADELLLEFRWAIEKAEYFMCQMAKMLYVQRDQLDSSCKAYGKRSVERAPASLLARYPFFAVVEGVVNADQLTKGLSLRPGIDQQELNRTLAKGDSQTRECSLYQDGDKLILAEKKGGSLFGSFIADITLTNDSLFLQSETIIVKCENFY